jgi:CelD/BcsL family acetyltransferase involved in cellulose biosynthesis
MNAESAATDMLKVSCIEDDEGLHALAEEWNRLAGDVPFRRWDWLEASWRYFRNVHRSLFTLVVRNDHGKLVGLAPWYRQQTLWQGRVVRLLGSDDACSDYLGVLAAPGHEDDVARHVADWLASDGTGRWDLLELSGVDAADPVVRRLTEDLERRGHTLHARNGLNCWRLQLPDHWDDYLATLSRNRRQQCRSLIRKTFDKGSAVLRYAEDMDSLQRGLEILVDLHQRRRASVGEHGCFSSDRFRNFLVDVAVRFLRQETLRLQWIEIDDVPVAVDFSLCGGDCTYGYQCGINPDFDRLRAGTLMMVTNLKSAIAQGYREFDFLRGDEDYKLHWGAEPRPSLQIRVVPPHAIARTRHRLWLTGTTIKRWMKASGVRAGISRS